MTVNWLHLPRIPFDDIMTMVAHKSLADLESCSEVCSTWNKMIEKDILKNPAVMDTIKDKTERAFGPKVRMFSIFKEIGTRMLPNNEMISNAKWLSDKNLINIEVIERFAARLREELDILYPLDSLSLLTCAASLAYHGLLGQADAEKDTRIGLVNVDLTSVPTEHLATLASWVNFSCDVSIYKVSGDGLTSFLNNLKCESLRISNQSLSREETQALVLAMESGVEVVTLRSVTLDMETLVTYNGQGRCGEMRLECDYNEDPEMRRVNQGLQIWARRSRNWKVTVIEDTMLLINCSHLVIKRR